MLPDHINGHACPTPPVAVPAAGPPNRKARTLGEAVVTQWKESGREVAGSAASPPAIAVPSIPVAPPDPTPRATDFDAVDGTAVGLRFRPGDRVRVEEEGEGVIENYAHPYWRVRFPDGTVDGFKSGILEPVRDEMRSPGPWDHAELGEVSEPAGSATQQAREADHARDHSETPGVMLGPMPGPMPIPPDPPATLVPPRPSTYLGGHPVADPPGPDHPSAGRVAALSAIDRAAGALLGLVGKGQKHEGAVCVVVELLGEARSAVEAMTEGAPVPVRYDDREPEAVVSRGRPIACPACNGKGFRGAPSGYIGGCTPCPACNGKGVLGIPIATTCPPPDPSTGDPGGAAGDRFDAAVELAGRALEARLAREEATGQREATGHPTERWEPYRGPGDKPAVVTLDEADLAYVLDLLDEKAPPIRAQNELRGYFKGIGRAMDA